LQVFLGQFTLVATLLDTRYGNQVISNTVFIVSSYSINLGKEIWDGLVISNILSFEQLNLINLPRAKPPQIVDINVITIAVVYVEARQSLWIGTFASHFVHQIFGTVVGSHPRR